MDKRIQQILDELNNDLGAEHENNLYDIDAELTKLREELAATQAETAKAKHVAHALSADLIAAEAKLKALDEQPPYAYIYEDEADVLTRNGAIRCLLRKDLCGKYREYGVDFALYTKPVPPVDVQELRDNWQALRNVLEQTQREKAELERSYQEAREEVTALRMGWDECIREKKLTRKLAEQQAIVENIRSAERVTHFDDEAALSFCVAMKDKLRKKREQGYSGWQYKDECSNAYLSELLIKHIAKGDAVDVANFCMMIHQRGEKIDASALNTLLGENCPSKLPDNGVCEICP